MSFQPWTESLKAAEPEQQMPQFTCIGCRLIFPSSEEQQKHFRTDFHIYNLRRKTLDYPPVTEAEFEAIQAAELAKQQEAGGRDRKIIICEACDKTFKSENAFQQHCKTKKHRTALQRANKQVSRATVITRESVQQQKRPSAKNPQERLPEVPLPNQQVVEEVSSDSQECKEEECSEESISDILDDDESRAWQKINDMVESGAVDVANVGQLVWDLILSKRPRFEDHECPFCSARISSLEEMLAHMQLEHNFRIPDPEYCVDALGVVQYVQDKIAVGRQCINCNRLFRTVASLRTHMEALCHSNFASGKYNIAFTDKALRKFYDYTQMWEQAYAKGQEANKTRGTIKERLLALLPGWKEGRMKREFDERFGLPKSFLKYNKFIATSPLGMTVLGITKNEETDELIMPDGRVIGHKALRRLYEQNESGLKTLVQAEQAKGARRLAIAQHTTSSCTDIVLRPTVSETRLMYMNMTKDRLRVQFKGHKQIKHFVDQNMIFQVPK